MSPQSQHLYSYVMNNPINLTDPTMKEDHLLQPVKIIEPIAQGPADDRQK